MRSESIGHWLESFGCMHGSSCVSWGRMHQFRSEVVHGGVYEVHALS
jgi:hypothetical protein